MDFVFLFNRSQFNYVNRNRSHFSKLKRNFLKNHDRYNVSRYEDRGHDRFHIKNDDRDYNRSYTKNDD